MASEPRRPPTRTGSGSRPPTSRFMEGSMNDRTSAAPPVQFMGPEQLKNYENQFYAEPPMMHEVRRPRPFSAAGKLQGPTPPQHADAQELQQQQQQHQSQKHTVIHKKSMGFFGRVRDVLFHRGGGQHGQAALKQQDVHRKHSSLQEPLQQPQMPPPPRPQFLQHAGRTQSEVNITQMFPDPRGGGVGERPSREDVLASYNQLVAAGFFQSHAIQSTRHAAPTAVAGIGGRQAPGLPLDHQTAPRPPARITSVHATARPGSVSSMPARAPSASPNPQGRDSREHISAALAAQAAPRTSLSSLFRPSVPDLHTKDSRYMMRGRKRTRGEEAGISPEPQYSSSTSYFTQPLKRVAKKLREMPSSSSQLNEKAAIRKNNPVCVTQEPSDLASADGTMYLVPSISNGGSLHPNERPIRLRSPSPAVPDMTAADHSERRSERPVYERATSATRARRPRRTFSYTVTESPRRRNKAAEREQERDVKFHLQQRGSSSTRADDDTTSRMVTRSSSRQTTRPPNPLGQWQRVSLEDTIIHRDSSDSTRSQWDWEWDQRQAAEVQIASSPNTNTHTNKLRKRNPTHSPSPLRAVPDVNRSAPKTPERWHYSGKAYHLKDRGSRLDLLTAAIRRSEDSGRDYGKENDWRHVDADGDIDVLAYENHRPREKNCEQQHQLHQWRIGNAL
ncbi:hypothetical protein F4782DRAFT_200758 [Xylaria castorea]|nr:hypothetical protein F4782DRAFT_200758 [Xylaria castorea]